MSDTEEIPIDAEGRAQCPKCKKWINCGPGGIKFLKNRHQGRKKCLEDAAKLTTQGPRMKDSSILSFLRAGPVAHVPSQTQAPAPVIVTPTLDLPSDLADDDLPPELLDQSDSESSDDESEAPMIPVVAFFKTPLANRFQGLVDGLPDNINPGMEDLLSAFSSDPRVHDNLNFSDDDVWEEILNPLLKTILGWGTSLDVDAVIRGPREGLMGVAPFVEYYVQRRQISEALFEGKLSHLMEGMGAVIQDQTVTDRVKRNKIPLQPGMSISPIPQSVVHKASIPSTQNPTDVERVQDLHSTKELQKKLVNECSGYQLNFPSGCSPHSNYPFALHDSQRLPWDYTVIKSQMTLYSWDCKKRINGHATICTACRALADLSILKGISKRIEEGMIPDHLPYAYRSIAQLRSTLKHKDNIIDFFRLRGLNQAKTLLVHSRSLSEYKRFMVAIAKGSYGNVERVIRIGLQQNRSITTIIASYYAASQGMYQPKSYTEEEDMKGLLIFKLGGNRVAGIAHRALGLPSVSTLRTRAIMPPLLPSHSTPTVAEVVKNIEACFESIQDILEGGSVVHQIAMFDEIATEKRLRWDEHTNCFLGVCREHGMKTSLEFNSVDDMEELFGCLERKEVHNAAEATVCALGLLSEETRIYAGRPILISGDCKRETGEEHSRILQVVVDAANSMKPRTKLRVVSLASDGETRRGVALAYLTFKRKLSPASPIFSQLSCLKFMDLYVGDDDLTADKDWKHVIKRFRNLLLRSRGVLVLGIRITPSIIESHLKMAGHSAEHLHSLFDPDDEQDVKLAFDLLKAIWSLAPLTEHRNPSVVEARISLRTLGKLLFHIILPYLCVDLSLSEQLEHFSAAAHLSLVLYRSSGNLFIPTQLYVDLMMMIKNVFFCVAKAKIDSPEGKFFVMLLGTDRLEELFGILRTMVGNDANLDIWQLASRLTGTTQVSNILAKYPQWDRSPRRLKLPAITRDSTELPSASDHIKPGSWRGDVYVKNVTLQTSWNRGRRLVLEECEFARPLLSSLDTSTEVNILAPFTKLLVGSVIDEEDESLELIRPVLSTDTTSHPTLLQDENGLQPSINTAPRNYPGKTSTPSSDTGDTQAEIEDELLDSNEPADLETSTDMGASSGSSAGSKHDRFIIYGGKKMLKSRALSLRSRQMGKLAPSSTDRLKRVQEVERYGKGSIIQSSESKKEGPDSQIVIQDPVATLVRCDGHVFLCVGEVNNIKIDSQSVSFISLQDIAEADSGKITVSISLLGLRRTTSEDVKDESADWRSFRMTSERTIHVPARFILPIDPPVSTHSIGNIFYLLEGGFLVTTAASIFGMLTKVDIKKLLQVPIGNEFPYCEETGKACFAISSPQLAELTETMDTCLFCNFDLSGKGGPRILAHMAAHILYDPKVTRQDLPCGLCLRPAPLCHFVLGKGSGGKANINWSASTGCPNKVNFKYAIAKVSTASSPCSNVPIACPSCPEKSPAHWRYNLREHFLAQHSKEAFQRHEGLWTLSSRESDEMKKVWKDRLTQPVKRATESTKRKVVVSEAHTSRATLRDSTETVGNDFGELESDEEGDYNEGEHEYTEERAEQEDSRDEVQPNSGANSADNFARLQDAHEIRGEVGSDTDLPAYIAVTNASIVNPSTDAFNINQESIYTPTPPLTIPQPVVDTNATGITHETIANLTAPVTTPNEQQESESDALRPQRKRGRINIQELSKCICGEVARASDGNNLEPMTIKCKQKSCETQWYHMACVNLDYIPRNWKCEACLGDRNSKRVRGL